ncbi:oxidoreductase [Weissella viridescens]|uniref:Oxidoreductase n=1 Tax=Weissella viridescens TaxID=1629 RepID=A0A3P2RFQ8_WEIVI|nr:FAD/NAD(P)-binding protein [Weissella viridescens]RRG18466.1 oxidoreductase [Weissella viridescens]
MNIVLIGAGPRNLVLAERLVAFANASSQAHTITLLDPFPVGGVVWNPDQNPKFIANTISQHLTLFTDDSVPKQQPGLTGPNLYEWVHHQASAYLDVHPFKNEVAFRDEIATLNPNHFASRAIFGLYAAWFFEQLQQHVDANTELIFNQTKVTHVQAQADGQYRLTLADGQQLTADNVIYTPGYTDTQLTDEEQTFQTAAQNANWQYFAPMQPSAAPLNNLRPAEPVLVRGLGLSFFDYMADLTLGRGGMFERQSDNQLVYHPAGREPHIIAGSRTGTIPHAKAYNQKPHAEDYDAIFFTRANIEKHMVHGHIRYADFYQLLQNEMTYKYYFNLMSDMAANWSFNRADFLSALRQSDDLSATANAFGIPANQQINWSQLLNPLAEIPTDYRAFMQQYLENDIIDARKGNDLAPFAGAFELLKDLRGQLRQYLEADVLSVDEYETFLKKFNPINRLLNVGPPLLRIEQLHALIRAGIVTVAAPHFKVTITDAGFQGSDEQGQTWTATQLVEARLPATTLTHTADPILSELTQAGLVTPVQLKRADGSIFEIDAVHTNRKTQQAIAKNGQEQQHLFVWGLPTEKWHWFTTFAPRPNVDDKNLNDAEVIAETIFNA